MREEGEQDRIRSCRVKAESQHLSYFGGRNHNKLDKSIIKDIHEENFSQNWLARGVVRRLRLVRSKRFLFSSQNRGKIFFFLENLLNRRVKHKEINPEYSLEGLMLKLKFQYFGHLMQRTDSVEKTLMLGKIEGRRRGRQRMRQLGSTTDSMDMNSRKVQEIAKDREVWCAVVDEVPKSQTQLSD